MTRLQTILYLTIACALPVAAQDGAASLSGTVMDPSRSMIQGARVVAISSSTGFRRETTTNAAGVYQLPGLAVGTYTVTISREGFKASQFKDVEMAVGEPRT